MLEVVTLFTILPDKYLANNAIPSALRKAISAKFGSFDVYQLAKYNKERAQKRKKKQKEQPQAKKAKIGNEKEEGGKPPLITLKQLIRKVHIAEPAENVMSIVGKKYPTSPELFTKTGLQGEWDEKRSGKRMKLPTPGRYICMYII